MKSQKLISLYISISMIILTQFANSEKINNIKKEFEIQIKQTGAEINSEKRKLEEENYILAYFQKDLGDFYWEGKREEEQEKLNGCLNSLIDNCIVPIYQENDNYTIMAAAVHARAVPELPGRSHPYGTAPAYSRRIPGPRP